MSHSIVLAGPAAETTRLITFWILAIASVAAALGMVLARKAVHCAILLAVVMLSLAVMYAMLGAPFLAFVQIIVYTGAVLMLFLFVLMIVGITRCRLDHRDHPRAAAMGDAGGHRDAGAAEPDHRARGDRAGRAEQCQVRQLERERARQPDLHAVPVPVRNHERSADHRGGWRDGAGAPGAHQRRSPRSASSPPSGSPAAMPTPLPGPGTYAQHNAVDMPALLPDGSQSELSVSPVLSGRTGGASGPDDRAAGREREVSPGPRAATGTASSTGSTGGQEAGEQ